MLAGELSGRQPEPVPIGLVVEPVAPFRVDMRDERGKRVGHLPQLLDPSGQKIQRPCPARPVHICPRGTRCVSGARGSRRSEEHTSELQSLMRISYAVFCLNKKKTK